MRKLDLTTMSGRFEQMRLDKKMGDETFIASGYGPHDDILDFVEDEIRLYRKNQGRKEMRVFALGMFYGVVILGFLLQMKGM